MTANPDTSNQTGLGLDVGERRIGVASAHLSVRFAGPLVTLDNPDRFLDDILALCHSEDAAWLVIGLPRGMQGQDTAQTARAQAFGAELTAYLSAHGLQIPVYWIDEALTSAKAEAELQGRTKRGKSFAKGDVDALAATYILEDFLKEHQK
jgi:putative Holliday junction resolvase